MYAVVHNFTMGVWNVLDLALSQRMNDTAIGSADFTWEKTENYSPAYTQHTGLNWSGLAAHSHVALDLD